MFTGGDKAARQHASAYAMPTVDMSLYRQGRLYAQAYDCPYEASCPSVYFSSSGIYITTPNMKSPEIIEATIRTHNLLIVRRVMFRVMSQTPTNQSTPEIVPK